MRRKAELIRQAQADIQRHWDNMPYQEKVLCNEFKNRLAQLPEPELTAALAVMLGGKS